MNASNIGNCKDTDLQGLGDGWWRWRQTAGCRGIEAGAEATIGRLPFWSDTTTGTNVVVLTFLNGLFPGDCHVPQADSFRYCYGVVFFRNLNTRFSAEARGHA